jgi:polyisoprenoid-binding protein YceI
MRKISWIALALALCASKGWAADKYEIEKEHTRVIFMINHLNYSNMIGRVKDVEGSFHFDEQAPEKSDLHVLMKTGSVTTDLESIDHVILGKGWLAAEDYPVMEFKSTRIVVTGRNKADITGNFMLHSATHPVVLHVTFNKQSFNSFNHKYVAGFSADAVFKRSDFGINTMLPDGDNVVVGDEVKVHIETEGFDTDRVGRSEGTSKE